MKRYEGEGETCGAGKTYQLEMSEVSKTPGEQGQIRHTNPTEECRLPPLVLSSEQRTVDGCADQTTNACCRQSDLEERKVRGVENIPVPTNAIPMRALQGA